MADTFSLMKMFLNETSHKVYVGLCLSDYFFVIMFTNNAMLFIFIVPPQKVLKHSEALQMIARHMLLNVICNNKHKFHNKEQDGAVRGRTVI
jgi:hypothetical protein